MRKIDLSNTYFYDRKVVPEAGDPVDAYFGAKLVNNLYNAYGVIGTVTFTSAGQTIVVNEQIYKMFKYPPTVTYIIDAEVYEILTNTATRMKFTDLQTNAYNFLPIDRPPFIKYMIYNDRIIFKLLHTNFIERPPSSPNQIEYRILISKESPLYVIYRLHGV